MVISLGLSSRHAGSAGDAASRAGHAPRTGQSYSRPPVLHGLGDVGRRQPLLAVQVGMGEQILITTFVVVVIGGVGSIRGAFFASLILGVVDTGLRAYLPGLLRQVMVGPEADALGAGISSMGIYLLMAIVLLIRPKGLFIRNS